MKPNDESASNLFGVGYISEDGQVLSFQEGEISLAELEEIAKKQQDQIEIQQQALVRKEQKLRWVCQIFLCSQ